MSNDYSGRPKEPNQDPAAEDASGTPDNATQPISPQEPPAYGAPVYESQPEVGQPVQSPFGEPAQGQAGYSQPGGYGPPNYGATGGYGQPEAPQPQSPYGQTGSYGQPEAPQPQSPYGQTGSYGQPEAPQPYAQPNYGAAGGYSQPSPEQAQPPYGQPGYAAAGGYAQASAPQGQQANYGYGQQPGYSGALVGPVSPMGVPLASWGRRAMGGLIDYVAPGMVISVLVSIMTSATNDQLGSAISTVLSLGWVIYNQGYLGGTTGQSWGRKIANTRLVAEATGKPIGIGMALLRQLAHIIDTLICYIGWLFPLWDAKRQTIADKITNTIVLDESTGGPTQPQQPYGY